MEIRVHQPGQLDFQIVTKDVSVTAFRRKPSAVWAYLKTPGHVIFFTRRGKRDCAISEAFESTIAALTAQREELSSSAGYTIALQRCTLASQRYTIAPS